MESSADNDAPQYRHAGASYPCVWRGDGWFFRDSAGYWHACDGRGDHPDPSDIPPGGFSGVSGESARTPETETTRPIPPGGQ